MNKQKIKEILEKHYFWFNEYTDNIDLGQHTPCGEDWFENLNWKDAKSFVDDLENRVKNFDVDEEVEVWIPFRGKRGVPERITDLIEDAEWKKQELKELLIDIVKQEIELKVQQYGQAQKRYHGDNAISDRLEDEIDSLECKLKDLKEV